MKNRVKSIKNALQGVDSFFRSEPNAKIHLAATVIVIFLSCLVKLNRTEILILLIVTGLVWVAELFNTAIERIMDFVSSETHPSIKVIKDISAAAVLMAALLSAITGSIIFLPKIL